MIEHQGSHPNREAADSVRRCSSRPAAFDTESHHRPAARPPILPMDVQCRALPPDSTHSWTFRPPNSGYLRRPPAKRVKVAHDDPSALRFDPAELAQHLQRLGDAGATGPTIPPAPPGRAASRSRSHTARGHQSVRLAPPAGPRAARSWPSRGNWASSRRAHANVDSATPTRDLFPHASPRRRVPICRPYGCVASTAVPETQRAKAELFDRSWATRASRLGLYESMSVVDRPDLYRRWVIGGRAPIRRLRRACVHRRRRGCPRIAQVNAQSRGARVRSTWPSRQDRGRTRLGDPR